MNSIYRHLKFTVSLIASLSMMMIINACSNDDPPLPDNVANFETSVLGLDEGTDAIDITVTFSRAVEVNTDITVSISTEGVTYGNQFTTLPAAEDGVLPLTISAGSNTASFKVLRNEGVFLEGDEKVVFSLVSMNGTTPVGETSELTLSFSSITSEGSTLTLSGLISTEAGSSAGNSVFVDLSSNVQTPVARTSWDLGFYSGDDFRVIINNTSAASVVEVNKTDITAVSESDVNTSTLAIGFGVGTLDVIDNVYGDITDTAIPAVSATDADNKVYVINRVGGNGATSAAADLIKIRVLRKNGGYTLQYAKLNETTFSTLDIPKDETHNFSYRSFTTGTLDVEPAQQKWDIQWTWSIYYSGDLPYGFSDLVFINHHGGTKAVEVLTSTVSYDDFDEADASTLTFSSERNVIGPNWRVTQPSSAAAVNTDRFYVIEDAAGNIYKLKFISFHPNDGGVRGNPQIEYKLVKKAS
jgi:hypothetical protein